MTNEILSEAIGIPTKRIERIYYNDLVLKTPLPNGSNYITLPQEEFDRVVEFLLEGAYV